ncbi:flagellin [Halobaculum sp. CBA1158]|uniref:archaellin/type IV pilin N-terminal domain-containing protein n=1 Tax=Halobaculum sp. CBA1158 TaxID=2904243 RepID=UPI001F37B450|nr:archaellin/type IV pilin N-terminal domain-containing protein [Halobaculum sp. CBA1158]UIO99079.1 flagellin [Halobaculum sp. CBA1158]
MFEFITDEEERGQVGIGTLIVFIAMVLVAAIAAGVLINTAGFLQSKSQETGEQSSKQVSDRLQEVATVGTVTGTNDGSDVVDVVNVSTSLAPGAGEIDLRNATVTWVGPDGTLTLVHEDALSSSTTVGYNATADDSTKYFSTSAVKDADDSAPVINDPDDRIVMSFNVSNFRAQPEADGSGNTFIEGLGEGEEATIKVNTMSGATTTIRFTVPESLGNKQAVEL